MPDDSEFATIFDVFDFLTRSENRVRLLDLLSERGRCRRRECEESLGISRTTVQRNLDALVGRGLVTESTDGYELTAYGQHLQRAFTEFGESVATIERLQPFLQWVSTDEFGVDVRDLERADVTTSTQTNPYAPLNRQVQALGTADQFRICTDVVGRDAFEQACQRVLDHGSRGELVLTTGAFETIQTDSSYRELFEAVRDVERFWIAVYDGEIPFSIGLIDGIVQIGVEDAERIPQALLESDTEQLREWARTRYREYRTEADPVQ